MSGEGAIIAFVGTTPNIGTTTAAFAAAYRLAEASGMPVGYFCLHLKSAKLHRFIGVDEPEATLDRLQPELRSAALSPGMLRSAMHRLPERQNLHILFGSMNRDQAEFYGPEDIHHLLDVAQEAFPIVVLDAGAYWDNAATVCSMGRADSRILVTTPALSHFQEDGKRWIGEVSPLFQVAADQYDCLVVRNLWNSGGYGMKHISKELAIASIGELELNDSFFGHLDKGTLVEWLSRDNAGKQAMHSGAAALMKRHRLHNEAWAALRRPWYRKLLPLGGGARSS